MVLDKIVHLERELEEEQLKNVRLVDRQNQVEKKRKRRASQSHQLRYYNCDDVRPLSPTMEPLPAKCSYQMPMAAASRGIKVCMSCIIIYCIGPYSLNKLWYECVCVA